MNWLIMVAALLMVTVAMAEVRTEDVIYEVGGKQHRGVIAYDNAVPGKTPGVVIFPEWWGVNEYVKARARMLAELGYVALVADMYGEGKVAANGDEAKTLSQGVYADPKVMLERAEAAVQALKRSDKADNDRVAAIGYCMGGNIALNLARRGADLQAVVAFHANLANRLKDGGGKPKAKILVCNGAEDKMISDQERQEFEQEMKSSGADWQYVLYGKAMHSFTNPEADKYKALGTIGYNQEADRRSWGLMKQHLAEALSHTRPASAERGLVAP